MLLEIDVSRHTGPRDWRGLADTGINFAFVKATNGSTFTDNPFDQNWQKIRANGVPCGAFHYARPGSDPATQAAHFHSVVGDLHPEDPQPVLDLEVGEGLSTADVLGWTHKFVEKTKALFLAQLIIYTGGFWRNQLANPSSPQLGTRKLWIARYGGKQPLLPPRAVGHNGT